VRGGLADRPRVHCGPSEIASRTSSTAPRKTDLSSSTRGPSVPHGLSSLSLRTVRQTLCNQKHTAKRIERKVNKNTRRTRRTAGSKPPHGPSARGARTVCVVRKQQLEPDLLKVNTTFSLPDLLKQPRDSTKS
jgi:hypothetical protein